MDGWIGCADRRRSPRAVKGFPLDHSDLKMARTTLRPLRSLTAWVPPSATTPSDLKPASTVSVASIQHRPAFTCERVGDGAPARMPGTDRGTTGPSL